MELKKSYEKQDGKFAEFVGLNKDLGIGYGTTTNRISELHFSIMIKIDNILESKNYVSNEENAYYFNENTNTLIVPIKRKTT